MARNRISSGLSITDITKMSMEQFEKYTPGQQREIVSRLASAANKRFKNLQNRGIVSPASIRLSQSGGKVSVRGKSGTELKMEMARAKQFLKSSLSTVTGFRKLEKSIKEEQERTGKKGKDNSKSLGLAFSYYDIISDMDSNITAIRDKYNVVEFIAEMIDDGLQYDQIIESTMNYLDRSYEESQRSYNETNINFSDSLENDTPKRFKRKRRKK